LINLVDEFVLYDDRQFTRRDWRNRNRVKTPAGTKWLTIPVKVKGKYDQRIDETLIDDPSWTQRHWRTLAHSYARAPHFDEFAGRFERLYNDVREQRLSLVNRAFIEEVSDVLGIQTRLSWATDYDAHGSRSERLVSLCRAAGATRYLSGPSARSYLDEELFHRNDIDVLWMNYEGYLPYPQLHGPFEHAVSILDLIFHTGEDAPHYMKTFGR
jgi:WbqC-like protein family